MCRLRNGGHFVQGGWVDTDKLNQYWEIRAWMINFIFYFIRVPDPICSMIIKVTNPSYETMLYCHVFLIWIKVVGVWNLEFIRLAMMVSLFFTNGYNQTLSSWLCYHIMKFSCFILWLLFVIKDLLPHWSFSSHAQFVFNSCTRVLFFCISFSAHISVVLLYFQHIFGTVSPYYFEWWLNHSIAGSLYIYRNWS